jgi:hypothetical protein
MLSRVTDPIVAGPLTAAGVFIGILVCLVWGRRIGQQTVARHGGSALPGAGSLEGAIFALLGLLIAFTFSGALTRFDERRAHVVTEANAIGTAYLRLDLLPAAAQPPLRATFRDYVDARLATYRKLPDLEAARAELARSQTLQGELWTQAIAAVRLPEAKPSAEMLLIPALNEVFDITTVRLAATWTHPPLIVYAMLVGLALASALLSGYQSANERGHEWMHKAGFATIVALTIYVILDIEYPRLGLVRVDAIDELLVAVRASMK